MLDVRDALAVPFVDEEVDRGRDAAADVDGLDIVPHERVEVTDLVEEEAPEPHDRLLDRSRDLREHEEAEDQRDREDRRRDVAEEKEERRDELDDVLR